MACNPRQDGLRWLPKTRSPSTRFKWVTTIYHPWKGYYLCDGFDLARKLTYPTGGHGSQFEPWARRGKYDNPPHPRKAWVRDVMCHFRKIWQKTLVLVTPAQNSIRFYRGKIGTISFDSKLYRAFFHTKNAKQAAKVTFDHPKSSTKPKLFLLHLQRTNP